MIVLTKYVFNQCKQLTWCEGLLAETESPVNYSCRVMCDPGNITINLKGFSGNSLFYFSNLGDVCDQNFYYAFIKLFV